MLIMVDGVPSIAEIPQENIKPGWTGLYDGYMSYETKSINPDWQALSDKYREKGDELLEENGYIKNPKAGFTLIIIFLQINWSVTSSKEVV